MFVLVDLAAAGRPFLEWIPGAIGIVTFGGQPAEISGQLVIALRHHVDVLNSGAREVMERFKPGDAVTVQNGPFSGYEAIFDTGLPGQTRAQVLLKMIQGQRIKVELPIEHIASKKIKFR